MERLINTLIKNYSSWGRRALVQARDGLASLRDTAGDNGNLLLCKARIAFADASFTTLRAIRSRFGTGR
jgi:hypothetical protein